MRRIVVYTAVAALLAVGCAGDDDAVSTTTPATTPPPPPTTVTTTTTTPTTTTTASPRTTTTTMPPTTTTAAPTTTTAPPIDWVYGDPADFAVATMIDPGQEPRRLLRYEPVVATETTARMTMAISLFQEIVLSAGAGASPPPTDSSTETVLLMVTKVLDVTPEGFVTETKMTIESVSAATSLEEALIEDQLGAIEAVSFFALVSPRGESVASALSEPIPIFDLIDFGIEGAVAVLPAEPIGIGGSWEVVGEVEPAVGGRLIQRSLITIVDMDADRVEVTIEVTQQLGPDGFRLPGVEVLESSMSTSGDSGSAVWDLTLPMAVSAFSSTDQTLDLTLADGDETAMLHQRTTVTLQVELLSSAVPASVP